MVCDFEHLFLVNNHAVGALEKRFEERMIVFHFLLTPPPAHKRVHHAALKRPRPEECDFVDEVIKIFGLVLRQEVKLPLRLDLEDAERFARTHHVIGRNVVERKFVDVEGRLRGRRLRASPLPDPVALNHLIGFAQRCEHAQAEHVELDETERFDVVFVKLKHLYAIRRDLDGTEVVEWLSG